MQWPVQSRLPTSAQSPGTPPPAFPRGIWRSGDPPNRREQNSITAIERALAALEPEDVSVKDGLEAVLRRAKDKAATPIRAIVPEVTFEAARVKVVKLETALAALSDCAGPEVDALQEALARVKVAASPPPVDIQLKQCQQFIDRTVKRIEDLDKSREVESVRLQEARGRLQRLQQEAAVSVHLQLWRQMLCQKWCRHSWQSPKGELWRW